MVLLEVTLRVFVFTSFLSPSRSATRRGAWKCNERENEDGHDHLAELELELIQSHMAQKPMLQGEVGARALRVRSDVKL